jgi:hypothetical protein
MSVNTETTSGVALILYVVICLFFSCGWIMNVYSLTQLDFEKPYKAEIIRTVGVVVPIVGAFTGWMDIGEEVGKPKK